LILLVLISILCLIVTGTGGAAAYLLFKSAPPITVILQVITATQAVNLAELPTLPPEVTPTMATTAIPKEETPTVQATLPVTASPEEQNLPPELVAQMSELEAQVTEMRGLQPVAPVTRRWLSITDLRQRILDNFNQRYSLKQAQKDAALWTTLGLLEPGFDLFMFLLQYQSEREAGFYDPNTKEIYLVQGKEFDGPAKMAYIREYFQALQDQNFDLSQMGYRQEACNENRERCSAIEALVEGDVSNLEIQWYTTYATPQDVAEIEEFLNNYESPMFDRAPAFMQQDFIFPNAYGQVFVETLHQTGGWEAVNEAYKQPPLSTEQILHPDRYPDDQPIEVTLPDIAQTLGEGWSVMDSGVLGEWYHVLILGYGNIPLARVEEDVALKAAEGWGGDAYLLLANDTSQEMLFVLQTVWDTPEDAEAFEKTFGTVVGLQYGNPIASQTGFNAWNLPHGYSEFHLEGKTTTWIVAPDSAKALLVWNLIKGQ
jgi:hypothetical protein